MSEQKIKRITVEMTLEEATELFDKGWRERNKKYSNEPLRDEQGNILFSNIFSGNYHFSPKSLSELIDDFSNGKIESNDNFYSSGRLYLARKEKDIIKVLGVPFLHEKCWKRKTPYKYGFCGLQCSNGKWTFPLYSVFSQIDFLDKDALYEDIKHRGFEIPINGNLSLTDSSKLPIWDKEEDFEKFLRLVYGNEKIDERLKSNQGFDIINPNEVSKDWGFFTTSLSPHPYTLDYGPGLNTPLHNINNENRPRQTKSLIQRGYVYVPTYPDVQFEGHLLRDYVQPSNLENGVVVMNEDRIPKYLKRTLGLDGRIK